MKKIVIIVLIAFGLIFTSGVSALTATPSPSDESETTETPSPTITKKLTPTRGLKATIAQERLETKTAIMERNAESKETFKERREAAKEEFTEARAAFKEKLDAMKDTRKQAILERIDERISNLNERHTERLDSAVTKLTEILEKIKTKSDAAKADGEEVDALEAAIESAEADLAAAQNAIDAQIEKEYVIDFSTESLLKTEATKVQTAFKTDIKAAHAAVKKAHMSVVEAAQELAKVKKELVKPSGSATNSGSMSDDESTDEGKMEL